MSEVCRARLLRQRRIPPKGGKPCFSSLYINKTNAPAFGGGATILRYMDGPDRFENLSYQSTLVGA